MSRLPVTKRTERTTVAKITPKGSNASRLSTSTSRTLESRRNTMSGLGGRQLATVVPSEENIGVPSLLQKKIFHQALSQSVQQPGKKVKTIGVSKGIVPRPSVSTKRGREAVVQQMTMETTVQRTPKAEYIGKTVTGIDVDKGGKARQIQMTAQQIDPRYGTESAGINETVSVTSSLSMTSGGKQLKRSIKKRTVKSDKLAKKPNLNPHHVSRLIKEENEDIDNTLKMVPPELINDSLAKFPVKKNLQRLRLSSRPVDLLAQSVVLPTPTADEVDVEAPPEVIAAVVDAVEKGATPDSAPNQIFNSLFPEVKEPRIDVRSVAPGPLEDLVVPRDHPIKLVEEIMDQDMENFLTSEVQNREVLPADDLCSERNIVPENLVSEGDQTIPDIIEGELPPWEDDNIRKVAGIVGGDPLEFLDASDITMKGDQELSQELSKGIEYFIDADVVPFETKIQLRGTKLPKWFPGTIGTILFLGSIVVLGYMSAFPHTPNFVKLSRTPSQVLHAAWRAVQPKIFPEDSILIA